MICFLVKPGEAELKAFVNLRYNNEFRLFMDWLQRGRLEALELLPKIDEEKDLTKLAGGVSVVSEILRTIDESSDVLDAISK
jgi:hypothetical protein